MKRFFRRKQTSPDAEQAAAGTETPAVQAGRSWRPWIFLLLCLAGSTAVSFAAFKLMAPQIPRELVGTWKVTDGALRGATLELRWDGTGVATVDQGGKKLVVKSTVKVDDQKIFLTSKNERTGKPDTVIQTILRLTDDELTIRDADHNTYRMVRVDD